MIVQKSKKFPFGSDVLRYIGKSEVGMHPIEGMAYGRTMLLYDSVSEHGHWLIFGRIIDGNGRYLPRSIQPLMLLKATKPPKWMRQYLVNSGIEQDVADKLINGTVQRDVRRLLNTDTRRVRNLRRKQKRSEQHK